MGKAFWIVVFACAIFAGGFPYEVCAEPQSTTIGDEAWLVRELDRMTNRLDALTEQVVKLREDVSALNVKAGLWGAIGGMIPLGFGLGAWRVRILLNNRTNNRKK